MKKILMTVLSPALMLCAALAGAAEPEEDKDFTILTLKRLLAEQTLRTIALEQARITNNLDVVLKQIEVHQDKKKEKK